MGFDVGRKYWRVIISVINLDYRDVISYLFSYWVLFGYQFNNLEMLYWIFFKL
jgi:hypothetical protein